MNTPEPPPHTGGPTDKVVVVSLEVMGEHVSAEHAALADILKYGMKSTGAFDVRDPAVGCGIYWTDRGFVSKSMLVPATPPPATPVTPATPSTNERIEYVRTYQNSEAFRVDQARLVPPLPSQASTPARNPAYNPHSNAKPVLSPEVVITELGVDPPGSVEAYGYIVELLLDNLDKRGPPETFVRQTTSSGHDLVFRLAVDTGGWVDSWIFGAFPWGSFMRMDAAEHWTSQLRGIFEAKNKIGHPPPPAVQDNMIALAYGYVGVADNHMSIMAEQTLVHVHCWDYLKMNTTLYAKKFVIGSVNACDSSALLRRSDGLLALGRWLDAANYTRYKRSGTWTSTATTLVGALYNARHIQHGRFYIRISHPRLESSAASFMCFGMFKDVTRAADPPGCIQPSSNWSEIFCNYAGSHWHPFWMVLLEKITIRTPGIPDVLITVGSRFAVDSGASHTYAPKAMATKIQEYLKSVQGDEAGNASNISAAATIVFTFTCPNPPGNGLISVDVTGQAIRFLVNPLASITGDGNPACVRAAPDGHTLYLLGLNFFRTFCVGFTDHALYPRVSLAPQRYLAYRS
ncbi:hypothetical protein EXIGLDRAFT_838863 [Exidia glandulosa HHB12029]|uniref:Peptidase A1 domain-containing protein n=1 Tax=Exidia glandulosa HHB12029 TaxID=1314781 RepID=A0A165FG69_EXIGL|nr:hypothetical protein EXIGLDRAFT_838863 [Exidia glandulosa HHB12029]